MLFDILTSSVPWKSLNWDECKKKKKKMLRILFQSKIPNGLNPKCCCGLVQDGPKSVCSHLPNRTIFWDKNTNESLLLHRRCRKEHLQKSSTRKMPYLHHICALHLQNVQIMRLYGIIDYQTLLLYVTWSTAKSSCLFYNLTRRNLNQFEICATATKCIKKLQKCHSTDTLMLLNFLMLRCCF